MGWVTDDGLHEGYLVAVFADGRQASGSKAGGPFIMLRDQAGDYTGDDEQRADDEIVAWQLICDCSTRAGLRASWEGPRWTRVATAALEDLENGRIYAEPGEAQYVADSRQEVFDLMLVRWRLEHLDPIEALSAIAQATGELAAAAKKRDEAVSAARGSGKSWADIGRAAGMSRQAAHDRWASTAERVEAARTATNHVLRGHD